MNPIEERPKLPTALYEVTSLAEAMTNAKLSKLRRDFGDDFYSLDKAELTSTGQYKSYYTGTRGWIAEFLINAGISQYNEETLRHLQLEIKEILLNKIKWKHLMLYVSAGPDGWRLNLLVLHKNYSKDSEAASHYRDRIRSCLRKAPCDFKPLGIAPWTLHHYHPRGHFIIFGNDGVSKDADNNPIDVLSSYAYGELGVAHTLCQIALTKE